MHLSTTDQPFYSVRKTLIIVTLVLLTAAVIAPPLINYPIICGSPIKALSNARNIAMALKTYAHDHEGKFPDGNSASEAFSYLINPSSKFESYISDKKSFIVEGSAYTPTWASLGRTNKALIALHFLENPIKDFSHDKARLYPGENHWGYMGGLRDNGNGRWPLIFEGTTNTEGRYSRNKGEKGGFREGKSAITVRLDGSANAEFLKDLYISTDGVENILLPSNTWAIGGRVLMPY